MQRPSIYAPLEEEVPDTSASTGELVRYAIAEARQLVELEVELARRDARTELEQLKSAAVAFAVAAPAAILGVALVLVAFVLAMGAHWELALSIGGALLVAAGIALYVGTSAAPRKPFDRTRQRLETKLHELRERTA